MTDAPRSQMIGSLRPEGPSNTLSCRPNTSISIRAAAAAAAALAPTVRVTILSLRGISVSLPPTTAAEPTTWSQSRPEKRKVPRLTASVTFSGSCPPESMQIPSSTLCGRSGRLKIVSGPTWPNITADDTATEECTTQSSLSVQWDTLPEGEGHANPPSLSSSSASALQGNDHQQPHLTVALPARSTESERQMGMDQTKMAPEEVPVAPSTGEPTGTSSGTPDEKNMPAQSAYSLKTASLEDDLDEPGVRFQMMQERVTAPTQMARSSSTGEGLPEIIEMNLTVHLDTIFEQRRVDRPNDDMNPQDDKEDDNADYDDEDGEAEDMGEHSLLEAAPLEDGIAHLVLFGGHARIEELDLPVRKRPITPNGRESVATIPSLSDSPLDSSTSTTILMGVALEDNAALRVRVEVLPPGVLPPALIPQPCPSMDESFISVQSFFSIHKERVSPRKRLMAKAPDDHTGSDDGSGGSMVKIPDRSLGHDSQKEKKRAAAGSSPIGARKVNTIGPKEAVKMLQQKQKEETAKAVAAAAARQQRQTSSDIVTNVRNRVGCFAFEGIGDILMSLAGHCNEGRCNDDNLYVYAADSMASTIDTFESL